LLKEKIFSSQVLVTKYKTGMLKLAGVIRAGIMIKISALKKVNLPAGDEYYGKEKE
jgi:hypothetical protein